MGGKDVVRVHSLRNGAAEAIEAIAQESKSGKQSSIGKELGEISLPEGVTIGALIRDDKGKIAHDHVHLRENDHVILFLTDKSAIKQVKETFAPKVEVMISSRNVVTFKVSEFLHNSINSNMNNSDERS